MWQLETREKPNMSEIALKTGIVRLSLRPKGSMSSVSVATIAPMATEYSRSSTWAKSVQPTRKQTTNIAIEPSADFLPSRPSLSDTVSLPKETPTTAALRSPRTRKSTAAIAIDGGAIAIVSVQPSARKHEPVSRSFSFSRSKCCSGQWRRTNAGPYTRARSSEQPVAVIAQHSATHSSLLQPRCSRTWCVSGTSSVHRWKTLRSISCIVRFTRFTWTPHALTKSDGLRSDLNATVAAIESRLSSSRYSSRKRFDGCSTPHGCEVWTAAYSLWSQLVVEARDMRYPAQCRFNPSGRDGRAARSGDRDLRLCAFASSR